MPFPTCSVPQAVRKLVFTAWLVSSILVLGPTATFNEVRYELNEMHYAVVCKYDNSYFASKVIVVYYLILQHLMPGVISIYINICVAKTSWTRQRTKINIQSNNGIRATLIATKRRGTYLLIAITLAFIISY